MSIRISAYVITSVLEYKAADMQGCAMAHGTVAAGHRCLRAEVAAALCNGNNYAESIRRRPAAAGPDLRVIITY